MNTIPRMTSNTWLPVVAILPAALTPTHADEFPTLSGPYLGQEPPGLIPELFAPFIAPPEDHKHSAPVFSPDGTEMFFSVYEGNDYPQKIKTMRLVDGAWSAPVVASFSGVYQEGGPVFSPDGNRLYYSSKRPRTPGDEQVEESDIWFVEKAATGWSDPICLGSPINTIELSEDVATFSPAGGLVFSRSIDRTNTLLEFPIDPSTGNADLTTGGPTEAGPYDGPPTPVGAFSMGVCYSADGNAIVVHVFSRDNSPTGLFISQRNANGIWTELTLMGDMVNRGDARFSAFSPDLKYLFFTSYRSGPEEIYWVDAAIVDTLLAHDLNLVDRLAEVVHTEGAQPAHELYAQLQAKHRTYYTFNHALFGAVGDKLMFRGDKVSAAVAYNLNRELFADRFGLTGRLKLAMARDDSSAITQAVAEVPHQTDSAAQDTEDNLNRLGYRFIRARMLPESLQILRLNTDLFPGSGNVFDSYAEALLISGDTAVAGYQESLRLDTANQNARNVLERLGIE